VLLAVPVLVAPAKTAPAGRPVAERTIWSLSTVSVAVTTKESVLLQTTDLLPMGSMTGG